MSAKRFVADAADVEQLVDRTEAAPAVALVDDGLGQDGPDARQRPRARAAVAVLRSMGADGAALRHRRCRSSGRFAPAPAGAAGSPHTLHEHALAVDELGREVQAVEIGFRRSPSRGFDWRR